MKIIDRYILIEFFKLFAATMTVLLSLFVLVTFFDLINDFLAGGAKFSRVVYYFILKMPEALFFMTPMAVLLSSVLTFSVLSRNREVIIMMSCGLSAFRIVLPVLVAALLLSILSFLNGDLLMPASWKQSEQVYYVDIKNKEFIGTRRLDRVWIKTPSGAVWNIAHLDVPAGRLYDVTVMEFSPDRAYFSKVITGRTAFLKDGRWVFKDGLVRSFDVDGGFEEEPYETKSFEYGIDFETLKRSEKKPQEMTFKEIRKYIERIRTAGYDDTRYMVDMYVKISFPLVALVMAFIAIPFGLKTSRAGGLFAGIALSLFLGFVFWFLFSMGVSLGYSGKLPPLLASTGAHLLFLMFAGYKMITQYYLPSALRH